MPFSYAYPDFVSLAGIKTTLASQQGFFNAMALHVKDLLGTIEACMISAANTSKLIQDVKLSAQSHKSSLKHLLNRHGICKIGVCLLN
jgi:hypothetical protein